MQNQDYFVQLVATASIENVVSGISAVKDWWAQEVDGSAESVGEQFTVHFGKTWATFEVTEHGRKQILWEVKDCYMDLLSDTKEWNNTRLKFLFNETGNQTRIDITHEGLTPAKSCFNDYLKGWDFYFKESLFAVLNKKKGLPGQGIHAWLSAYGHIYKGKLYPSDQLNSEMKGDLLLIDIRETKGEQVLSAHCVRPFSGQIGKLDGTHYMLLKNTPGLRETLELFFEQTSLNETR